MSSTVTTTTVAALSASAGMEYVYATLTFTAVVMLAFVLVAKEIAVSCRDERGRRLARGLDIATTPLLIAFSMTIVMSFVASGV